MLGFLSAFGLVLLLLGVTLRFLKRFSGGTGTRPSAVRMEVVQRLALGPKQGLAVVRIGDRVVAVSLGEGGVRPILELDEEDLVPAAGDEHTPAPFPAGADALAAFTRAAKETPGAQRLHALMVAAKESPKARRFQEIVRAAIRSAALVLVLASTASLAAPSEAIAQAQVETVAPAARAQAETVARTDTMLSRLAPSIDVRVGEDAGGLRLSGTVGVVVMMGLLTLLPTLVLMMTSFTRIFVVLHFLRQAIGTQSAPPGHLMAALALLLTGFVMGPTLSQVNQTALEPWMAGQMEQGQMLTTAAGPFREFMLAQTREQDIGVFLDMRDGPEVQTVEEVPLVVLMSAFVTSELRTAFQIGFALFLPFIVIDVVVASVLMSMGMFMLPPPMIALPFKILLFVLVDGWTLIVQGLVSSFN